MTSTTIPPCSKRRVILLGFTVLAGICSAAAADNYELGLKVIRDEGFRSIDKAIECFRRAVKPGDPSSVQAKLALADALIMKYELSDNKDTAWLEEARAGVTEVLRLKPGYPAAYFSMANVLLDLGKEEEGARYLKKAVLACPEDERINSGYFMWLVSHSRIGDAVRFAAESEKLFRDKPGIFRTYGAVLLAAGRSGEALRYLLLVPANGDVDLDLLLADALRLEGKYSEALVRYEAVMKSATDGVGQRAWFGASCCFAETGNTERAVSLLKKHLVHNQSDAAALNNMAILLERLGRIEEARQMWVRLQSAPGATPDHLGRARKFITRHGEK